MNAEAALLTRTERHLPITDWLSELVLEVLDGASTHQAASVIKNIFPEQTPSHWKLRQLAQAFMMDRDKIGRDLRRITTLALHRAAKNGWTVSQAAIQNGLTASEVVLTINLVPGFFVSHRELVICEVVLCEGVVHPC